MIELVEVDDYRTFDLVAPGLSLFSAKHPDTLELVLTGTGGIVSSPGSLSHLALSNLASSEHIWYLVVAGAKERKKLEPYGKPKKLAPTQIDIKKAFDLQPGTLQFFLGLSIPQQIVLGRAMQLLDSNRELIAAYLATTPVLRPFALQDAFVACKLSEVVTLLADMRELNADPLPAVAALFTAHTTVFAIHQSGTKAVVDTLKKHPFYVEKLAAHVPRYCRKVDFAIGVDALGGVLDRIKSGTNAHDAARAAILRTMVGEPSLSL